MAANPYNELQYLKNLYETEGQTKGKQQWAAEQAKQYYGMLDPNEAKAIQGMNGQQLSAYLQDKNKPQQPQQAFDPNAYMKQYQDQINNMYNQQKEAQLAQLRAQREKAVGQINQQKAQVAPAYQTARNQTDAVNLQNVQRLREAMANAGLTSSGENVTAQVAQNNQRQANLNSLNLQERQTIEDFDRRITDLNNPNDELALISALEAERSRALLDIGLQADQIGYSRSRDSMMDNRWQQQWDYQRQQDSAERAWREYTYNNMSASERAQLEWAKSQYGEDAAWRMFQLKYQGELSQSLAQSELNAYSGFLTP